MLHKESKWSIPNIILAVSGIAPADTGKLWCLYRYATFLVVAAVLAGVVLLARDMPVGSGLYFHMSLGCLLDVSVGSSSCVRQGC